VKGEGDLEGYLVQIQDIDKRRRAEEQLKASLKEKEVLLKEIHHRVKNNLQVISSLFDMTSTRIHDQQANDLIKDARTKIHTMALIHARLYGSERVDQIDMRDHIRELANYLSQVYSDSKKITLIVDLSSIYLPITQAIPCALVLNEVISNAFKHAFREGQKGTIEISVKSPAQDTISIRVKDDGIGIPQEVDIYKTDSLGLKLLRNLVQSQLKGKIDVKRDKGTEFIIEFKTFEEEAEYVQNNGSGR
jgi:two-component sensor histidine kinase